jgi:hypothetical protein
LKIAKHFFKNQNFPLLSSFKKIKLPHTLQQKIPAFKKSKSSESKKFPKQKKEKKEGKLFSILTTNFM